VIIGINDYSRGLRARSRGQGRPAPAARPVGARQVTGSPPWICALDQAIAVSFSSTSISQAAACKIASRCASFDRRKVTLSSVKARL